MKLFMQVFLASYTVVQTSYDMGFAAETQEHSKLVGHRTGVKCLAFSHDGSLIASGDDTAVVKIWNAKSRKLLADLRLSPPEEDEYSAKSLDFSHDDRTLAVGYLDSKVRLWNIEERKVKLVLQGHQSWINSVKYSRNGEILASASDDETVRLWNTITGELKESLGGCQGGARALAFSHSGSWLAAGCLGNTIKQWKLGDTGKSRPLTGQQGSVFSLDYSPDGVTLASGGADGVIDLWDLPTSQIRTRLVGHKTTPSFDGIQVRQKGFVWCVAFSPDGKILASGAEHKTIILWNAETGHLLKSLTGHQNRIKSLAFSPDGKLLASGSDDRTVRLWEISKVLP